jgi:hypothetical protein
MDSAVEDPPQEAPRVEGSQDDAQPNPLSAITDSLPPATDYLTYLTILESHLSPDILPKLNDILQDEELTQNIGWDLIHLLLPLPGGEKCLETVARLGNPREVVLKVTEALQILELDNAARDEEEEEDKEEDEEETRETTTDNKHPKNPSEVAPSTSEPTEVDKFCILVNLLQILHPRIKTQYPSRFLSTSLMAILAAFRPSNQATLAVISFVHTVSGKKRPPLPGRSSSMSISVISSGTQSKPSAPDPEAQEEDPREAAIQKKLLQSFVTHILEDYVNENPLEWSGRLQELYDPKRVVSNKKSLSQSFRDLEELQTRDTVVGQLIVSHLLSGNAYKKFSRFDALGRVPSSCCQN